MKLKLNLNLSALVAGLLLLGPPAARADSYYLLSMSAQAMMPPHPFNPYRQAPLYPIEPGIWLVDDTSLVAGAKASTKAQVEATCSVLREQLATARRTAAADAEAERLKPVVPVRQYQPMAVAPGHQLVIYGSQRVTVDTNDPTFSLWFLERRFPGISTNFSPELRAKARTNQPRYIIERRYPQPKDPNQPIGRRPLDRDEVNRLIELQKQKEKETGVTPTEPVLLKSSSVTHPGWPFDTNATAGYELTITPQRAPNTTVFTVATNWTGPGDTNLTAELAPVGLTTIMTFFDAGTNGKTAITEYFTNQASAITVDLEDYKEFELGIEYPAIVTYEASYFTAWLASFDPDCVLYPDQPTMVNGAQMTMGQTGGYWKFWAQEPCHAPWPAWATNVFLYFTGNGSWGPDLNPWQLERMLSSNPYIAYPPPTFPPPGLPPPPIIGGGGKSFWKGSWQTKPTLENPGAGFPGSPGPQSVQTDISGYSEIEVTPTNSAAFYFMLPTH